MGPRPPIANPLFLLDNFDWDNGILVSNSSKGPPLEPKWQIQSENKKKVFSNSLSGPRWFHPFCSIAQFLKLIIVWNILSGFLNSRWDRHKSETIRGALPSRKAGSWGLIPSNLLILIRSRCCWLWLMGFSPSLWTLFSMFICPWW